MGQACYRASAEARALFKQADVVLGYSLSELCFDGPVEKLNQTQFAQPALFVTTLAMWAAVKGTLQEALAFVAGHSVGEFAALTVAEGLDFADGLQVVAERGRLMAEAGEKTPGGMAVLLGATLEAAESLCAECAALTGEPLVIANDNCPGQVVISGAMAALEEAAQHARAHGVRRVLRLAVSVAPHSPLMAPLQDSLASLLATVRIRTPRIPVVFNATAMPIHDTKLICEALIHQLVAPVRWRDSLLWMAAQGVSRFREVGPKAVLTGLVQRTLPTVDAVAMDCA